MLSQIVDEMIAAHEDKVEKNALDTLANDVDSMLDDEVSFNPGMMIGISGL